MRMSSHHDGRHAVRVVYEDNHLLVLEKPAGVPTQADASGRPSLQEEGKAYLKTRYAKPGDVFLGLVHRIDRPVAGLVVFARTSKAAGRLSEQMRERRIGKFYLALVEGRVDPPRAKLAGWLVREGTVSRLVASPRTGAQDASLTYEVRTAGPSSSVLEVELHTGRKHQIRAQLAGIGHPIVGDRKYGARTPYRNGAIALVAWRLEFEHPTRKEAMHFEMPAPPEWAAR